MSRLRTGLASTLRDLDPRTVEGPKLVLLILCLTSLFARIDEAALGVLLPQIRAEFGVSLTFLGSISAAVSVLFTLMALPMGYLADRVRRVWMVRIGSLTTAATVAVQGAVGSVPALVGARLANGVAQGIAPPASFPLMADWFPRGGRARVFGIYFAAAQIGLVVGPLTAGLLGDAYGWRPTLLLLGGLAFAAGLLTFFLREPVRGRYDREDESEPPPDTSPPPGFVESYRAAASVSTLRRLWYATPLLNVRAIFTFLVLPIYLSEVYGLSTRELGLVNTVTGVVGLVAFLLSGAVGGRLLTVAPGRFMVAMGTIPVLQAVVVVVVSLRPPLPVALLGVFLIALLEALLQPAFYILISFVVPARIRGLGLSTAAPWALLGAALTPLVLSVLDRYGTQRGILVFVPILVVGGLILLTGGPGVERDIKAARAADAAETAARAERDDDRSVLLVCREVDVGYDGVQVLFGVDLDLLEGEIVALVGTNGAGKSTMLRAIAGTQEASGGAIVLDGRDTTHLPPHENARLGVVLMPGGAAVFPSLTVGENLQAATTTVDDADAAARTAEVLELFPVLHERWDSPAGTLSGGEQQMVGVSQALLMAPRLLLVDELSLGLAPAVVEQLLGVLRTLNERGTTIVMVEQSLNVALTIADRAVFMEKGEVRFDGPVDELLARPDLVRSVFMGGAAGGTRSAARPRRDTPDVVPAPALEVRDLRLAYGGVVALDGVDLSVQPGEVVGIVGPNGAGKTTLFDVVSGFTRPDTGTVLLSGVDVSGERPDARARRGLGRSFQNARLFPALTVRETIATALERRAVRNPLLAAVRAPSVRKSERRISRQVDRLVDLLGLEAYADTSVGSLSTGSRRAVDVACILALEPSLLLLDEPSSGLAQAETEALGPLLARIVRETGCGMVVIEHDIPLVSGLSDRLVAMAAGAVLVSGTPEQVRADPRVLSSFLAASDDVVSRSGARMSALAGALSSSTLTTPTPEQ